MGGEGGEGAVQHARLPVAPGRQHLIRPASAPGLAQPDLSSHWLKPACGQPVTSTATLHCGLAAQLAWHFSGVIAAAVPFSRCTSWPSQSNPGAKAHAGGGGEE